MKKGISLVALVITMIVLMILTAVVINIFVNDRFVSYAKKAKFQNDISLFREELTTSVLKKKIDESIKGNVVKEKDIEPSGTVELNTIKQNYIR